MGEPVTVISLGKRLAALEATRAAAPVRLTPEEAEAAARAYEASLSNPALSDPRAVAYWQRTGLVQLSDDYTAMLKGPPEPWEIAR